MKISFIGAGTMASSMMKCIIERGVYVKEDNAGSSPRLARMKELSRQFGIKMMQNNAEAASFGDIVVLSVKPQIFLTVARELKDALQEHQIVLSIMAGIPIEVIQRELAHKKVVRVMSNTPVQVGHGMSVWTATEEVSEEERIHMKEIFSSMGKEFFVRDENYVDMATALNGTGPAFVFLFLEAMISAGVHLGFSRRVSKELVYQTVLGSILFAMNSDKHTAELRDMVTSPEGTTTEALYELEKGTFRTVLEKAVYAAYKRTKYLGELSKEKKEGGQQ
jgi:pyrroline-5-carboxylate reductase